MKFVIQVLLAIAGFVSFSFVQGSLEAKVALAVSVTVIFGVCTILGWIISKFIGDRVNADGDNADIFAWSGLVLWIFPVFGFINAAIVGEWSKMSEGRKLRYEVLSTVGAMLSLASAVFGAVVGIEAKTGEVLSFAWS